MEQTIYPMIAYENAAAAMRWLVRCFGFVERKRILGFSGDVVHGELELAGGIVMVASPTPNYRSPLHHAESCEDAQKWQAVPWIIDSVLIYVDDLHAHFNTAKAEGVRFLSELESGGAGFQYRALDVE